MIELKVISIDWKWLITFVLLLVTLYLTFIKYLETTREKVSEKQRRLYEILEPCHEREVEINPNHPKKVRGIEIKPLMPCLIKERKGKLYKFKRILGFAPEGYTLLTFGIEISPTEDNIKNVEQKLTNHKQVIRVTETGGFNVKIIKGNWGAHMNQWQSFIKVGVEIKTIEPEENYNFLLKEVPNMIMK
jgi:hypothetical protein